MADIVISILAFAVAIGVMVTVHEYGHYWVARRCGVRVLRFSVGFGRALWRRTAGRDRTEWVIAALPLGGYVKMLDEREGEVDPAERHRAFNTQPVGQRAAIVAAGPVINVLLGVVAYSVMFLMGVQGAVPLVGGVAPGSPAAAAGFERGDRIVAVANGRTPTWSEFRLALLEHGLDGGGTVPVKVDPTMDGSIVTDPADDKTVIRHLSVGGVSLASDTANPVEALGFEQWLPAMPARIVKVLPDSPAAAAGLRAGDRVLRVAGQRAGGWRDWAAYIRAHPGDTFQITIVRDGNRLTLSITPEARQVGERTIGRIGAYGPGISAKQRERMFTTVRYGPIEAVWHGVVKTWEIASLTAQVLVGMATGQASLRNISGPITIARYAGRSVQIGLATFIGFIALISVSIGLLNLLPIPVLDGGHLLYYAIEAIKGSPVSERVQAFGQQIGVALLFGLMALALYNDVLRLVH